MGTPEDNKQVDTTNSIDTKVDNSVMKQTMYSTKNEKGTNNSNTSATSSSTPKEKEGFVTANTTADKKVDSSVMKQKIDNTKGTKDVNSNASTSNTICSTTKDKKETVITNKAGDGVDKTID